jgi:hypothetical protein
MKAVPMARTRANDESHNYEHKERESKHAAQCKKFLWSFFADAPRGDSLTAAKRVDQAQFDKTQLHVV